MPGKSKGSSRSKRTNQKVKKKKRDKFVTNAVMLTCTAILLVVVANLTQNGIGQNDKNTADNNGSSQTVHAGESYNRTDKVCTFDFIDVGQGDSALITTPGGEFILVDTGTAASRDVLFKHLESRNVDEIDYLILTHPHSDHIGGAGKVLEEYDVNCIIMPNAVSATAQFEKLFETIAEEKENGCKVYTAEPGDIYNIDGCLMKMIGPAEIDEDELNNCSAAFTFTYGEFDALFTGDSEKKAEKLILSLGANIDCELYKAAHHGSDTSSCEEFINAVTPQITVISCGKDNSYGHPSTEIVQRLYDIGSEVYVTSEVGTITVLTDGDGYSVSAGV